MKNRITQKQLAFYKLYKFYKSNRGEYLNTWEFVGEIEVERNGGKSWEMMSYKCPTRLTDIFQENPDLLDREWVRGKSGSEYYQYRLAITATPNLIKDPSLIQFFREIKK